MLPRVILVLLPLGAFAQSAPVFDVADIRVSPPSSHLWPSGPYFSTTRYEFRNATMVDLISAAYGMDQDKIFGGPSWMGWDRFDIVARPLGESSKESRKLMLQTLLAERFGLAIRKDSMPLPAYALSAGKHAGLKEADPAGEPGCKVTQTAPPAVDGVLPMPKVSYSCHNMTMPAFAEALRNMNFVPGILDDEPIVDKTGLTGAWDFTFQYAPPARGQRPANPDVPGLFGALEAQLGLKLESTKTPMPVMVVDSVNRKPSANPPDVEKRLPALPTEFEVAEIKPAQPQPPMRGAMIFEGAGGVMGGGMSIKNGRVMLTNFTLNGLITMAWNISFAEELAEAPKWINTDHYDVIAKVPHDGLSSDDDYDFDPILPMLQKLLIDRFKLAVHTEERPVNGFALTAGKPKMTAANPTSRTQCTEGPGPDGKDPRAANPALSRLIHCQNVSMDQLAMLLPNLAGGYFRGASAVNATGLKGGYDFTLSFSAAGIVNGAGRKGGGDAGSTASDPSGGLSLFDALTRQLGLKLEQQKLPRPVLVIDRVEQKPTDH